MSDVGADGHTLPAQRGRPAAGGARRGVEGARSATDGTRRTKLGSTDGTCCTRPTSQERTDKMSDLWLTPDEVADLTGLKARSRTAQLRRLAQMGVPYILSGDSKPLVRREQVAILEKHHAPPRPEGMTELLARIYPDRKYPNPDGLAGKRQRPYKPRPRTGVSDEERQVAHELAQATFKRRKCKPPSSQ